METLLTALAAGSMLYLIVLITELTIGFNKIKNLSNQAILNRSTLPSVSIMFTALNEENNIESGLTSILNQDYPNLEVIVINDRSTDKTPEILARLEKTHPRLRVYHISELPENWFGKNHGLHVASQHATGEWLLFTDSDVSMKKDTILKTISYALENKLDHLTIHEYHTRKDFWHKIMLLGYYVSYSIVVKPWRIRYSWSKASLGRAVFNLVKTESYKKCGGHEPISLECLDDMKLGELIKKNGFRQDVVNAQDHVEFQWYNSLKEMVVGLEKNGFAYHKYQLSSTLLNILFAFIFFIWPFIAVFAFSGWVQTLNLINIGAMLFLSAFIAKQYSLSKYFALFYPIGVSILVYTVWNSLLATYKNKGVIWRGTFYSLDKLRNKKAL
jgi:glycosyltransferase involved in cell wall biosynthesis